jgi:predicted unusual protein kinase regulating ubiquinone biosynthesis (AarF/ABC1/UbiB family)
MSFFREAVMSVSLKPSHLKRYRNVAKLFIKYGRSDLVKSAGLDEELEQDEPLEAANPQADELASDLEKMGPTFIKLGQLLSSRGEMLPPAYLNALERLQDNVAPFPFEQVEAIVTEELGVRISKGFSSFEREPLAAASLGQVHRAALRDGRQVVVKVQRPGIRQQVVEDLEAFAEIAGLLEKQTRLGQRYELTTMIEEFRKSLLMELDYRKEAQHLSRLGENLRSFDRILVPAPVDDYTTSRVLTMDYVTGKKITALSPLRLIEVNGEELAEELFRAYLKQIFIDGFFHADPHPGNVFLTEDDRIALLDLGMVASVPARMQEQLLQMVLAVSEGRSDEAADAGLKLGESTDNLDEKEFRRRVAEMVTAHQSASIGEMKVGKIFLDMSHFSAEAGVRLPAELTMLGKALLNLDGIGRILAPEFDPNASIRRNAARLMNQRMLKNLSPGRVFGSVLEMKEMMDRLPGRVNKILDNAANNQLGLKIDTGIDAAQFMVGLQKVANRITVGLILAALIVGAALLMRVETTFRIAGYPGLAMLCFLVAGGLGLALLLHTLWKDVSDRGVKR